MSGSSVGCAPPNSAVIAQGSQSALFILSKKISARGSRKVSRRRSVCTLWRAPNCPTPGEWPGTVVSVWLGCPQHFRLPLELAVGAQCCPILCTEEAQKA